MSHADPRVRALMRAEKALKSAVTHMRNAGNDPETNMLRTSLLNARNRLHTRIKESL